METREEVVEKIVAKILEFNPRRRIRRIAPRHRRNLVETPVGAPPRAVQVLDLSPVAPVQRLPEVVLGARRPVVVRRFVPKPERPDAAVAVVERD